MKFFTKTPFGRTILGWLFHKYCLFVFHTNRIVFDTSKILDDSFASGKPLIFAFWHGRMFLMPLMDKTPHNTYVLVSRHGDGALIARALDFFSLKQVRGSTNRSKSHKKGAKNRGGEYALRECVTLMRSGKNIAITPDGPGGPEMHAQDGIVHIARITGAVILPITFSSSRSIIIKSWDRFMLPLPFGKIVVICAETLTVPEEAEEEMLENTRKEIENRLNTITRIADEQTGVCRRAL